MAFSIISNGKTAELRRFSRPCAATTKSSLTASFQLDCFMTKIAFFMVLYSSQLQPSPTGIAVTVLCITFIICWWSSSVSGLSLRIIWLLLDNRFFVQANTEAPSYISKICSPIPALIGDVTWTKRSTFLRSKSASSDPFSVIDAPPTTNRPTTLFPFLSRTKSRAVEFLPVTFKTGSAFVGFRPNWYSSPLPV